MKISKTLPIIAWVFAISAVLVLADVQPAHAGMADDSGGMENMVSASKDLLLIYNTNSPDSIFVKDYYLAHRPMVAGANVLGIGCPAQESVTRADYTTTIRQPVFDWLMVNPTKHPQYWILFLDVPSRIHVDKNWGGASDNSVSYELRSTMPDNPYVTHINLNGTNDCKAYINKLESIGRKYSPGKLVLSATAGGYGNTNYYFDDSRDIFGSGPSLADQARSGAFEADSMNHIVYVGGDDHYTNLAMHITSGTNVCSYLSWGEHSAFGGGYPINQMIKWHGHSSWWIIETIESFNGTRDGIGQGNFIKWFSANAFGGTNYSNTPVGAVCYTDEPGLNGVNNASIYFRLWASGKNFAIAAWDSRKTTYFQAVGDPLVTK